MADTGTRESTAALLRRAAAQLREDVERLPEPWRTRPWRAVQSDTESMDALAACTRDHTGTADLGLDEHRAWDCCWSGEPVGHEAVAALASRMHPPVALALADWLEHFAQLMEEDSGVHPGQFMDADSAITVARAVLREEPTP